MTRVFNFSAGPAALPEPGDRLRLLSPFDPALRDRARAERLFGFRYRIEIFVPAPQRTFGYYVFPLLEGTRLVARTEAVFVEPASAASVAGLLKTHADGRLPAGSTVVCTVTGNGLKDPDWAIAGAPAPITVPVDALAAAAAGVDPIAAAAAASSPGPVEQSPALNREQRRRLERDKKKQAKRGF